jgi:DNA transformation protein and related proteins
MQNVPAFVSHCLDLLAPLGAAHARRMFGGHGLYVDDLFVALIADERLYMKADDTARPAFERAGCEPFAYSRRDRGAVTLGYWTAPEEALDSPRTMEPWARLSLAAALRAKATGPPTRSSPRKSPVARGPAASQRRAAAIKTSKARATKARG